MTVDTFTPRDDRFERELKAVLDSRAPHNIPMSLYQAVAELLPGAAAHELPPVLMGRPHRTVRFAVSGAVALVAVVLAGVLAVGLLASYGVHPSSLGAGNPTFDWHTDVAALKADSLTVDAAGTQFNAPRDLSLHSDLGTATYRTLEMVWNQGDIEMRVNFYLAADDSQWWVSSIRTYNGKTPGDWLYYLTPGITAPRGQSFTGDLDLFGAGLSGIGRLTVRGASLSAFEPGTGVPAFTGCTPLGAVNVNPLAPSASEMNPRLPGVDLSRGMPANEAESNLRAAHACFQFRYDFSASNQDQVWCVAPPGTVDSWVLGPDGEIILFVEAAPSETIPADQPRVMGCH